MSSKNHVKNYSKSERAACNASCAPISHFMASSVTGRRSMRLGAQPTLYRLISLRSDHERRLGRHQTGGLQADRRRVSRWGIGRRRLSIGRRVVGGRSSRVRRRRRRWRRRLLLLLLRLCLHLSGGLTLGSAFFLAAPSAAASARIGSNLGPRSTAKVGRRVNRHRRSRDLMSVSSPHQSETCPNQWQDKGWCIA